MLTLKALGTGTVCAVALGMVAAAGVPTAMKPAPEPHWRQLPKAQAAQHFAVHDRFAMSAPIDLDPSYAAPNRGYDRLAEIEYYDPEFSVADLSLAELRHDEIKANPTETLVGAQPATAALETGHDRAARDAERAQLAALAVIEALDE